MHYQLLVTMSFADDATSAEVRRTVYDTLLADSSFCGEGGCFGSPLCDWFVIGGRWSGLLAKASLGLEYQQAVASLKATFGEEPPTAEAQELPER